MSHLMGWLLVCAVIAVALRKRPVLGVCLALLLWLGIPAIAGNLLTGLATGALAFHPATWLLLVILLVQLIRDAGPLVRALARHVFVFLAVFLFAVTAFVTSRFTGSHGTRLLLDQIVGPGVLVWLVLAFAEGRVDQLRSLRNTVIVGAAAESILALIQFRANSIIFYGNEYASLPWFDPETFDRWMGTTDSPLVLSLLVCVAGGLTVGLRRWWLRSLLLIAFLMATLIVQSRTGSAVMVILILLTVVRSRMMVWARALSVLAIVVAGYFLLSSRLVAGISERLTFDSGSADARLRALQFIAQNIGSYLLTGGGLTSSYSAGRSGGLQTSIESSFLMYTVDTGLLMATLYFGLQVALLIRYGRFNALPGAVIGAAVGVALQHTFSGVAGTNLCGVVIWSSIALVVGAATVADPVLSRPRSDEWPPARHRVSPTSGAHRLTG